ncbi:unnamed protein product [Urochloa humidicola]
MTANVQGDHTSQHPSLLELLPAISVDTGQGQSTMAVEQVATPPKPPWSLIYLEDVISHVDLIDYTGMLWPPFMQLEMQSADQLRPQPWPSFDFPTVVQLLISLPVEPLHAHVLGKAPWPPPKYHYEIFPDQTTQLCSSVWWSFSSDWVNALPKLLLSSQSKVKSLSAEIQLIPRPSFWEYDTSCQHTLSLHNAHPAAEIQFLWCGPMNMQCRTHWVSFCCPRYAAFWHLLLQYHQQQAVSRLQCFHAHGIKDIHCQSLAQGNSSATQCWKHWLLLLDSLEQNMQYSVAWVVSFAHVLVPQVGVMVVLSVKSVLMHFMSCPNGVDLGQNGNVIFQWVLIPDTNTMLSVGVVVQWEASLSVLRAASMNRCLSNYMNCQFHLECWKQLFQLPEHIVWQVILAQCYLVYTLVDFEAPKLHDQRLMAGIFQWSHKNLHRMSCKYHKCPAYVSWGQWKIPWSSSRQINVRATIKMALCSGNQTIIQSKKILLVQTTASSKNYATCCDALVHYLQANARIKSTCSTWEAGWFGTPSCSPCIFQMRYVCLQSINIDHIPTLAGSHIILQQKRGSFEPVWSIWWVFSDSKKWQTQPTIPSKVLQYLFSWQLFLLVYGCTCYSSCKTNHIQVESVAIIEKAGEPPWPPPVRQSHKWRFIELAMFLWIPLPEVLTEYGPVRELTLDYMTESSAWPICSLMLNLTELMPSVFVDFCTHDSEMQQVSLF